MEASGFSAAPAAAPAVASQKATDSDPCDFRTVKLSIPRRIASGDLCGIGPDMLKRTADSDVYIGRVCGRRVDAGYPCNWHNLMA